MESLLLWPEHPALSILAIWAVSQLLFFGARFAVHRAFDSVGNGIARGLRLFGRWCGKAAVDLRVRNREVMLEAGRAELEKKIDRDFVRIQSGFTRELQHYPELHAKLEDVVGKLEADYDASVGAPPAVPGWPEAVRAVTAVSEVGERSGKRILAEIHKTAVDSHKKTLREYRDSRSKRHRLLSAMTPLWKETRSIAARTKKVVEAAIASATKIDAHIDQYEKVRRGDDTAERLLASSAWTTFTVSLVAIIIAMGGAFVNFQLIALPMSELVPGGSRMLGVPVSTIAALVIVLMEASAGLFLMEALGITELFPQIGRLTPGKRRLILAISFSGLFLLAAIECSLAVLREQIVAADMLLKQSLAGTDATVVEPAFSSIPIIGQAVLGFILPWLLAVVAIPLESLVQSGRHVAGRLTVAGLSASGSAMRAVGQVSRHIARVAGAVFDIYIAVPLLIERAFVRDKTRSRHAPRVVTPRPEPTRP